MTLTKPIGAYVDHDPFLNIWHLVVYDDATHRDRGRTRCGKPLYGAHCWVPSLMPYDLGDIGTACEKCLEGVE